MPIPKHIHQIWTHPELPEIFAGYARSWSEHNPGYTVTRWDWPAITQLMSSAPKPWQTLYAQLDLPIMQLDLARYVILHTHGGIYADMDFECIRPLGELPDQHRIFMGYEPDPHKALNHGRPVIGNALLASEAEHPFWRQVIERIELGVDNADLANIDDRAFTSVVYITGPVHLTRVYEALDDDQIKVFPSEVFFPKPHLRYSGFFPSKRVQLRALQAEIERHAWPEQTLAVHHWASLWASPGKHIDQFATSVEYLRHIKALVAAKRRQGKLARLRRDGKRLVGIILAISVLVFGYKILSG